MTRIREFRRVPCRGLLAAAAVVLALCVGFARGAGAAPLAAVTLNGSAFHRGDTITYQATLTPDATPRQVDIYLGTLLPDGRTFLSLVQSSPGVISTAVGPAPIPFLANVPLTQTVVPFSYTFTGGEPVGTYVTHAIIVTAGTQPMNWFNPLGQAHQSFQFNSAISVTSLNSTSAMPMQLLTITGSGFDPTAGIFVQFSNNGGFSVGVPPVAVDTTSVTVSIPPFTDPSTGEFGTGTVSVQVVQITSTGTVNSNAVTGFQIQNLPTPASTPGTTTLYYLTAARLFAANTLQTGVNGTTLDTPAMHATLANLIANLDTLIPQIQAVVQDPTTSFILGSISGTTLTVTATDLARVDRMILGLLAAQASSTVVQSALTQSVLASAESSTTPGCQAKEAYKSYWELTDNPKPNADVVDVDGYFGATNTSPNCKSATAVIKGVRFVEAAGAVAVGVAILLGAPAATLALPTAALLYITLVSSASEIAVGGALGQNDDGARAVVQDGMKRLDELAWKYLVKGVVNGLLYRLDVSPDATKTIKTILTLKSTVYSALAVRSALVKAPPFNGGGGGGVTFNLTASTAGTGAGKIVSYPGTIVCGAGLSVCADSFPSGKTILLNPTPSTGSIFTGWSGACSGTGTCAVVMDGNKAVTATFTSTGGPTLLDHTMTNVRPTSCTAPPRKSAFQTTDTEADSWIRVSGVQPGDTVQWEWRRPDDSKYTTSTSNNTSLTGEACFWGWMYIAGHEPSTVSGTWSVRVLYNGNQLLSESFTIGAPSPPPPPPPPPSPLSISVTSATCTKIPFDPNFGTLKVVISGTASGPVGSAVYSGWLELSPGECSSWTKRFSPYIGCTRGDNQPSSTNWTVARGGWSGTSNWLFSVSDVGEDFSVSYGVHATASVTCPSVP